MIKFIIKNNQKLIKAIMSQFPTINPQILRGILAKKDIKVNNVRVNQNIDVFDGDEIQIFIPEKYLFPKIQIIYQDQNIIVVNKPTKIEVISPDKDRFTLTEILKRDYPNILAIHRLDTNTTGLTMFAQSSNIKDEFIKAFENHCIEKHYVTIAYSKNILKGQKFIDYFVEGANSVKVYSQKVAQSLPAELEYSVLNKTNDLYLLDIKLQTGRTHQIRAQLAHHNIFILGDGKYGDKYINRLYKAKTQKLCAYKLSFHFPQNSILHYLNDIDIKLDIPFKI